MAQSEISQEKIEAYDSTLYRAGLGTDEFILRIGEHSPELATRYEAFGANCALFITAFNPFGQKQDENSNENAHERLGKQLRDDSDHVIKGVGFDPTGAWSEKSYLAFGIDAARAEELGRLFQQDAVVWIGEDAVPQLMLLR